MEKRGFLMPKTDAARKAHLTAPEQAGVPIPLWDGISLMIP